MSKYTTELRFICEQQSGLDESVGYDKVSEVIDGARPKIFSFDYPIFDPAYKPTFERKFLRHFYTREIATETYGLWKLKLEAKLNEIMPYYNKLYESELIEFNPLYDTDLHTEGVRHNTENGTTTGTTGGSDTTKHGRNDDWWSLYSDTPQGGVNGIIGAEDDPSIARNGYLTNATHHLSGEDDGYSDTTDYGRTTGGTSNVVGNGDYAEHVYGYRGRNPSKSLIEFRNTFLNIDMMVLEELEDLFFQLW